MEEAREYVDEIVFYIRDQFVDGRMATAKALVMDCVVVAQNRSCIAHLDKVAYGERGRERGRGCGEVASLGLYLHMCSPTLTCYRSFLYLFEGYNILCWEAFFYIIYRSFVYFL